MKFVHIFSFVFLGLWLILTGFFGLAGVVVTPVFAVILNLLAVVAGVFFLISVGKCCNDHRCCCNDKSCTGKHE